MALAGGARDTPSVVRHHVFLVPGFFGFANFGDFRYFAHAREHLLAWTRSRGIEVAIHYAPTYPTASLRRRAGRLAEIIAKEADDDGPIHLIGHSTGGLDARLAVAPRVSLGCAVDPEVVARRVRTVVAVASPHHGAPTAAFFTSLLGQRALFLISLLTMHAIRLGTIPLPALLVLASALGSAGAGRLVSGGVIEQVYAQVLKDFTAERRAQIERVFDEVRRDQTLLVQLTPEGMDLFNALATEREGVRRGCVVAQAKPPTVGRQLSVGVNPTHQAMYNVFRALYAIASTLPEGLLPMPDEAQAQALIRAYGRVPSAKGNDAMVPTRSQVWGEVVHAAWADHLDVIGHFHAPAHAPLHVDWLRTMSDFGRREFEAMWNDVARFTFA
jgi:triacylglycerol lipase